MDDRELQRALGRIEGQLEGIRAEQKRISDYAIANSSRIGALEQLSSHGKGWAAGIGAGAGATVTMVWSWVRFQFGGT